MLVKLQWWGLWGLALEPLQQGWGLAQQGEAQGWPLPQAALVTQPVWDRQQVAALGRAAPAAQALGMPPLQQLLARGQGLLWLVSLRLVLVM